MIIARSDVLFNAGLQMPRVQGAEWTEQALALPPFDYISAQCTRSTAAVWFVM